MLTSLLVLANAIWALPTVSIPGQYIVVFKKPLTAGEHIDNLQKNRRTILNDQIAVKHDYNSIKGFSASTFTIAPTTDISILLNDDVAAIYPDQRRSINGGGAKVGMAVGARAVAAAVPGLNLIFAADMAYQLAKLGGLAVKAGINFGKDGMKSMQGNMHTGVFGAGYKDDEVRATSRARGVSAIQNSRLNARSLLGSEGAMMASHFG